jgi:hypothetical protein
MGLMRMRRLLFVLGGFVVLCSPASAAADAGACPNEALRAELQSGALPDCRAYELVTPPFKSGQRTSLLRMLGDGSRLLVESNGAFAGTESHAGRGVTAIYELTRLDSGWSVSSANPPAAQFPAQRFVAASADLNRTLWALRAPSQSIYAEDYYVREADGSLVEVGPTEAPAAASGPPAGSRQPFVHSVNDVGASADLSHVLFELYGGDRLWPGDTTHQLSSTTLYEYVGTGNKQPQLVGVDATGHLISDCGTSLGSFLSYDTYGAVSADGEKIFFTPWPCGSGAPTVGELYARLGQLETVAISEPSAADCRECQTAVKAAAEFRGASVDGSKVFFATEQQLLAGDTTENLYEYDFDNPAEHKIVRVSSGSPTPEVLGVARVSADGSHVYFLARGVLTEGENAQGLQPLQGGDNLYVFERDAAYPNGHLAFVATLSEADGADWSSQDERPVQATPDGRFVVFESTADLTPGDTSTQQQVFEYDAQREVLVRISRGAAGYAAGLASADANGSYIPSMYTFAYSASPIAGAPGLAVSADGSQVVFVSAGALTADAEEAAAAGAQSVYEYRSDGSIASGDVHLISASAERSLAEPAGISETGADVFFRTASPLLAQDTDTQFDIYDARVNGGFPAAARPAVCAAECQGALPAAPSFTPPGTASLQGGADLAPPTTAGAAGKPKAKPLSKAQKLARALRACKQKRKRGRAVCEAHARKRYGIVSGGHGKRGR